MLQNVHRHYILPIRVVYVGLFSLAVSILLNTLAAFFLGNMFFGATVSTSVEPSKLPVTARTVALEVIDTDRYGIHDDNDWASVIPHGHGFVRLGSGDDSYYAVSMYHQLHCLNSIRKLFNGRNASRVEHDAAHVLHCLTYMRQMVLCSADTTLEPAFFTTNVDGRKTQAAYGTGVTHECHDWVQVRNWVESNYEEWKDDEKKYVATEASAME